MLINGNGFFFPLFCAVLQNEWVICRVFQKSSTGKKIHISGIMRSDSFGNELGSSVLPPLADSPPSNGKSTTTKALAVTESAYVPCFSKPIDDVQRNQAGVFDPFSNTPFGVSSNNPSDTLLRIPFYGGGSLYSSSQVVQQAPPNWTLPGSDYTNQDQTILRALIENHGSNLRNGFKPEREMESVSQETALTADVNNEISSVVSNFDMCRRHFENQQPPPASAAPQDLASLWNY